MFGFRKPRENPPEKLLLATYHGRDPGAEPSPDMKQANPDVYAERWQLDPRRINLKALLILLGICPLAILAYFSITYFQQSYLRKSALAQARQFVEKGQLEEAFLVVERFAETWPDDLEGLAYQGEFYAKYATLYYHVNYGTKALEQLLRLDPDSPGRQADRRRLIELMIRQGDIVRASSVSIPGASKQENLYRAANLLAEQRIKGKDGVDDAEAHRLLAMTFERLMISGDAKAMAVAITEYRKALRKDAGDHQSAERLASLQLEARNDQAGADRILDDLVKARPRSLEARLVRARYFLRTNREDRAKVELEAATRLDPTASGVRMMAASLAIRRGDVAAARRHLDAVPESDRENSFLPLLTGQLELADNHPEKAIEVWRKGLIKSAGTDRTLTWRLAFTLIRIGKPAEARPLIDQFRRLVKRDDAPMLVLLEAFVKEQAGKHSSTIAELLRIRELVDPEWKAELEMTLGRCYKATGNLKDAETAFVTARSLQPSWTAPRLEIARIRSQTSMTLAEEELEEGLKLARGGSEATLHAARVQMFLARELVLPFAKRDWRAVQSALDRGQKACPGNPELAQAAADYLIAAQKPAEALAILEESTRGAGRLREEAWLSRANLLVRLGRQDEGVAVLEEAASPNHIGDVARLRIARSKILLQAGKGRAALDCLTRGTERLSLPERIKLIDARANTLTALMDMAGARAAYLEWANLAPDDSGPGTKLIELAGKGGSPDDAELGLELLRKAGGEDEPTALAARAMFLLEPKKAVEGETSSANLDEAEVVVQRLKEVAPELPSTSLAQALFLERSRSYEEAIAEYKLAVKNDPGSEAMPRLVALLTHLKRSNELALLKAQSTEAEKIDLMAAGAASGFGDQEQAGAILQELVTAQPDSFEYRTAQAKIFMKMGKPEQAVETLKILAERHVERPQPWLALVSTQMVQQDKQGASLTIEKLKKSYKGERLDLLLARCLWITGDPKGATLVLDESLAKNPRDLRTIEAAAQLAEVQGPAERYEALLRQALKLDPNLAWANQKLALQLLNRPAQARWTEAWSLVSSSSPNAAEKPEARLVRAMVLQKCPDAKRQPEAIKELSELADDLPVNHPVGYRTRLLLARSLLAGNDAVGAAKAIAPISIDPSQNDPRLLILAIEALARAGRTEEARQRLERLSKIEPDSVSTVAVRALVMKSEGDKEGAIATIETAALADEKAKDGEKRQLYYFNQLVQLGFDDEAGRLGRKMVSLWPNTAWSLAAFQAERGQIDDAVESIRIASEAGSAIEPLRLLLSLVARDKLGPELSEKASKIAVAIAFRDPRNSDLMSMSAWILRRKHRYEDEAALYRQVLTIDPSNIQARNNLAWVLGENLGRPVEGLAEVDTVIRQIGLGPQTGDTRGVILMKLGRWDEAITELERSTKADPSTIHYLHLSRAMAGKGKIEQSRALLQEAKKALTNPQMLEPEDLAEINGTPTR